MKIKHRARFDTATLQDRAGGKPVFERATAFLEARLAIKARAWMHHPVDLLVSVLMHEKKFDTAWAAAGKHEVSPGLKQELARASEVTCPREALKVYEESVERFAVTGGNSAYAEAAKLIAHMVSLRSAAEQAAYVAALKERHDRKRNFIKLLGSSRAACRAAG
jgi:hypothetical protein